MLTTLLLIAVGVFALYAVAGVARLAFSTTLLLVKSLRHVPSDVRSYRESVRRNAKFNASDSNPDRGKSPWQKWRELRAELRENQEWWKERERQS